MDEHALPARVAPELQQEIEQFLYAEAALLDAREFDVWLSLLADDLHYFMPIRRTLQRRERGLEISAPDEVALFDEDKPSMVVRVRRLHTGMAWAEEPPSRTRHLVSNVRIGQLPGGEFSVRSYFALHRNRLERDGPVLWRAPGHPAPGRQRLRLPHRPPHHPSGSGDRAGAESVDVFLMCPPGGYC
ncbi:MAG TPA: aromatic-ring-hydroxylating dioxygenase subunit beta [Immundisolibacter sp.]